MEFSKYQLHIFDETVNGNGNVVVEALAGSAKSTSLVESLKRLNEKYSFIVIAFNTKIVEELKQKVSKNVLALNKNRHINTIHSYGLKCLGKTFKNVSVENDKTETLISKTLGKKIKDKDVIYQLIEVVRKAKLTMSSSKDEIVELIDRFEIDLFDYPSDDFVNHVQFLLNLSKKYNTIVDMEDMIWLPNVIPVDTIQYDYVFVDEAQDMFKAGRNLIRKALNKNGRLFAFLDENQAIMSWCGTEIDSVKYFKSEFNAKTLPLPICYRCPKKVIEQAQKFVPEIQAAPNAKEGFVASIKESEMFKLVKPGNVIISRYNAPLLSIAMKLVSERKPCIIQGRDIGNNLISMIKQSKAKSIDGFLKWLEKWKNKECARLARRKKDATWVTDRYTCLTTLCSSNNSLKEMKDSISKLFVDVDDSQRILLSSIHKFKGMENDTVFVLAYTLRSSPTEERNLSYVGVTRSKNSLYYVYKDKKKTAGIDDLMKNLDSENMTFHEMNEIFGVQN